MILHDRELAFDAGHDHGFDFARKQQFFRRDELEVKCRHKTLQTWACAARPDDGPSGRRRR
jgi:hypothetical protein